MDGSSTVPENTVYVGNVDPKVSKELLYELFLQISPVAKIRYPKDKVLQTHQGFAFVEFNSPQDAEYASKCLNNTVRLYDRTLKVRKANGASSSPTSQNALDVGAKLFIKNIDELVDSEMLTKIFGKFGSLVRPPEIFTLKQGLLRCAYICYSTFEHSDAALEKLNNQMVMNKCISIDYAYKEGSKTEKHGDEVERLLDEEAKRHSVKPT